LGIGRVGHLLSVYRPCGPEVRFPALSYLI
jgi:hypothetical protein